MDPNSDLSERGAVLHMLGEMKGMLHAVLGRLDGHEREMRDYRASTDAKLNDHQAKITALELVKAQANGGFQATKIIVHLVWTVGLAFAGLIGWLLASSLHLSFGS